MASSRSWPFDEDDRPSGSVRPLGQADLQAMLAHLNSDPTSCWLAPTPIGRWWRCGSEPVYGRTKPRLPCLAHKMLRMLTDK
jgi:hypothetical protein